MLRVWWTIWCFCRLHSKCATAIPFGGLLPGYGSSFPLDREMTTRLLGFDSMDYNVVYAQMGRGKMERNVAFALASIAGTVSKMAFDACMFSSQNFGFVKTSG